MRIWPSTGTSFPIAMLAGMLWAVANTLTVFAIRDVGLAIAFPLWNTNSLVGIFWGRLLFGELKGASRKNIAKVVLGALAIVVAAVMLGFSTIHGGGAHATARWRHSRRGRREPAVGHDVHSLSQGLHQRHESALVCHRLYGRRTGHDASRWCSRSMAEPKAAVFHSRETRHLLFWLFLGGFVWVIGDLFQQFATKYLGIGRGIPLSNTNQIWGLAWGALVFGELAHADAAHRLLVVAGSLVMISERLPSARRSPPSGNEHRCAKPGARVRPLRARL